SYVVDKHGNPLSAANGIGMIQVFDKMLTTVDLGNFPAPGTLTEMSEWSFNFNAKCDNAPNNIYALGSAYTEELVLGSAIYNFVSGMVGGTGCNAHDNSITAKVYLAQDGRSSLIKVKFDKAIKYN